MLAIASALVCRPELLLVDELSLGLAPVVVEGLLRRVMENGRIVLDGTAERLRSHPDIQEFYLGRKSGERRNYRDVKQYRRSRRWYG